jgi:drug/metabolite transporter (DMT)-like permease
MLSWRFFPAGLILFAVLRLRGVPWPNRREALTAAGIGILMLGGGTGGVAWAEQTIHSGLAALLVAVVPLWMVLLDWLGPARRRPTRRVLSGLAVGFVGVGLIVGPTWEGLGLAGLLAVLAVMFGTICWAVGSVFSRYAPLPKSPFMASAIEMLAAGLFLFGLAGVLGETRGFEPASVTRESALAVLYLVVFGSLIAYAAYVWLIHNTSPARVSSYAYVNPFVAMLLGVWLGNESFGITTLVAASLVVGSVVLITLEKKSRPDAIEPRRRRRQTP